MGAVNLRKGTMFILLIFLLTVVAADGGEKDCYAEEMMKRVLEKKPGVRMHMTENIYSFTWRSILLQMTNCNNFHGDLWIDHKASQERNPRHDEFIRMEDLKHLNNLTRIYGSVFLSFKYFPDIKSLSFFKNLREINGSFFRLERSSVEALNLTRVAFNVRQMMIFKNPRLCFLDNFSTNVNPSVRLRVLQNKNTSVCRAERKTCDPACADDSGCLGPGNQRCAVCRGVRAGLECVANCQQRRGFFRETPDAPECRRCHPQCRWSCSGPAPRQCDFCRNAKDGDECVSRCPAHKYLEKRTGRCRPCSRGCYSLSELAADTPTSAFCSGPRNASGQGGCTLWCPGMLYLVNATGQRSCRPCHARCRLGCDGDTDTDCRACRGVKMFHGNSSTFSCLDRCPDDLHPEQTGADVECVKTLMSDIPPYAIGFILGLVCGIMYVIVIDISEDCSRSCDITVNCSCCRGSTPGIPEMKPMLTDTRLFRVMSDDFFSLRDDVNIEVALNVKAPAENSLDNVFRELCRGFPELENEKENVKYKLEIARLDGVRVYGLARSWIGADGKRHTTDEEMEQINRRGRRNMEFGLDYFREVLQLTTDKDRIRILVSRKIQQAEHCVDAQRC